MKLSISILCVLAPILVASCATPPPSAQVPTGQISTAAHHSVLPSTLVRHIHLQLFLHPETDQQAFVRGLEDFVVVENLSEEERFFLGELHFLALRPDEAYAAFEPLTRGGDWRAHSAWNRRMIMEARAYANFEALGRSIAGYRAAYQPTPEYFRYSGFGERSMCLHLGETGDHGGAVAFVMEAVRRPPLDAPYGGFCTVSACYESFVQTNRQADAIREAERVRAGLATTLAARQARAAAEPAYDATRFESVEESQWYGRSSREPYNFLNFELQKMIGEFDKFLACRRDGDTTQC